MDFKEKLITDQQKTIESLSHEISALRQESAKREEEFKAQIGQLNQEIANLSETLRTVAGRRFAPSSESAATRQIEGQLELDFFNEAEYHSAATVPEPTVDDITITEEKPKSPRKPRGTRDELFSDLPIREELYQLPEEEKICQFCDSELTYLGKEVVREEIRIIPAQVERVQIVRECYICSQCKEDDVTEIAKAAVPSPLLKHSLASPSIVAHIMYQKYVNALPLHRQEKDFKRLGVRLSRSVQANWVNTSSLLYLQPIYDRLHEALLKRDVAMSDETTCQVHHEKDKKNTSKSYMWIHRSGEDGLSPIILYDYQPGRSGDYAVKFLKGFTGYHHCDGFSGYNKLKDVTRIACLAHLRRKFIEAVPKRRTGEKRTPAEEGVLYCNKLFELERKFASDTPDIRQAQRLEQSKPVLDAFWCWLDSQNPPSGSNLYKAVTYARNQKEHMNNFLLDGRLSISNSLTENSVRPYTLIRKNSLFHDTPNGATASAIICSIMETAKASGLDVEKYLEHLLSKMPECANSDGIEALLPWYPSIKELCASKQM